MCDAQLHFRVVRGALSRSVYFDPTRKPSGFFRRLVCFLPLGFGVRLLGIGVYLAVSGECWLQIGVGVFFFLLSYFCIFFARFFLLIFYGDLRVEFGGGR